MSNEANEKEIDLIDMLFYAFHHWRSIILAGLIMAVLVGGYKYWNASNEAKKEQEDIKNGTAAELYSDETIGLEEDIIVQRKKILEIDTQINAEQKKIQDTNILIANQQNIIAYNRDLIEQNQILLERAEYYLDNSILMKAAEDLPLARKVYTVLVFDDNAYQYYRDPADEIVCTYKKPSAGEKELNSIAEKYSIPLEFLNELYAVNPDTVANTVEVTANGLNEEMAEEILEAVCKIVERDGKKIKRAHQLDQGVHKYSHMRNQELVDSIGNYRSNILSYKNNINTYKAAIDSANAMVSSLQNDNNTALEQIKILNDEKKLCEGKQIDFSKKIEEKKEEIKSKPSIGKTVIKYVVIGFIAGAAILFMFHIGMYALRPVLRMPEDIKSIYGYPILGVFNKKVNSRNCSIDRWIMKAEGRGKSLGDEVILKTVAISIANLAEEGANIALLTTLKADRTIEILYERLSKEVPKAELTLLTEGIAKASNVDELSHCDAVVLLEERNDTSMIKLAEGINQIKLFNKKVLGAIIL